MKNHDFTQKYHILFPILGGVRRVLFSGRVIKKIPRTNKHIVHTYTLKCAVYQHVTIFITPKLWNYYYLWDSNFCVCGVGGGGGGVVIVCNQCLSLLELCELESRSWRRGVLDTTLCEKLLVTFGRLVVFSGYSRFLHQ